MADTPLKNAYVFAERLRREVAAATVTYNDIDINYSISIGVAEVDEGMTSPEAWIECADAALYSSKETGRNKTSLHPKQKR